MILYHAQALNDEKCYRNSLGNIYSQESFSILLEADRRRIDQNTHTPCLAFNAMQLTVSSFLTLPPPSSLQSYISVFIPVAHYFDSISSINTPTHMITQTPLLFTLMVAVERFHVISSSLARPFILFVQLKMLLGSLFSSLLCESRHGVNYLEATLSSM